MFRSFLAPLFTALVLSACVETVDQNTTRPATAGQPANYLFGWAMYAEPVFDRDVILFEQAFAGAFGTPADSRTFGFTSNRLESPVNGPDIDAALASLATQAVDGQDTVVVMVTTHGSPDVLALRPFPDDATIAFSADRFAELLAPLSNDLQIIIIQACFSGSLIDELRAPNRIIMTAAAADRSSFGCNPNNNNTFFIQAMNQALAQGGSWSTIFAQTEAIVRQMESDRGLPASNPQSYIGGQMQGLWAGAQG